jgi:hypothetical protein
MRNTTIPNSRLAAGRARLSLITVAALAVVSLYGAAPGSGSVAASSATSCPPISAAKLHSVIHLPNSFVERNDVASNKADDYVCSVVLWSGTPPVGVQAAMQRARSGHAAQVGIESWTPNEASPDVATWRTKDYDTLTGGFQVGSVSIPGLLTTHGWPSHRILPFQGFGFDGVGDFLQVKSGVAKGLVAAVGCWWNDSTYSAVCIADEEAAGKPVARHLNQLAKVAVAKIIG